MTRRVLYHFRRPPPPRHPSPPPPPPRLWTWWWTNRNASLYPRPDARRSPRIQSTLAHPRPRTRPPRTFARRFPSSWTSIRTGIFFETISTYSSNYSPSLSLSLSRVNYRRFEHDSFLGDALAQISPLDERNERNRDDGKRRRRFSRACRRNHRK